MARVGDAWFRSAPLNSEYVPRASLLYWNKVRLLHQPQKKCPFSYKNRLLHQPQKKVIFFLQRVLFSWNLSWPQLRTFAVLAIITWSFSSPHWTCDPVCNSFLDEKKSFPNSTYFIDWSYLNMAHKITGLPIWKSLPTGMLAMQSRDGEVLLQAITLFI